MKRKSQELMRREVRALAAEEQSRAAMWRVVAQQWHEQCTTLDSATAERLRELCEQVATLHQRIGNELFVGSLLAEAPEQRN